MSQTTLEDHASPAGTEPVTEQALNLQLLGLDKSQFLLAADEVDAFVDSWVFKIEKGKTPRPPNSFVCFRVYGSNHLAGTHQHSISKLLSILWHQNLDEEDRNQWKIVAKCLEARHKREFPHYVFKPDGNKKPVEGGTTTPLEGTVGKAPVVKTRKSRKDAAAPYSREDSGSSSESGPGSSSSTPRMPTPVISDVDEFNFPTIPPNSTPMGPIHPPYRLGTPAVPSAQPAHREKHDEYRAIFDQFINSELLQDGWSDGVPIYVPSDQLEIGTSLSTDSSASSSSGDIMKGPSRMRSPYAGFNLPAAFHAERAIWGTAKPVKFPEHYL
ncbi:hypothetical protein CVT24_001547 [Panaeolus cyanescens]|uniref:HMG box domain-containing protein n=1 Tax=Panaeolus cyanescens TaxID=181874 RepID=A0A409W301_9AGAR|nr:hypothetical protein CVT24_001547 [Panaeolus cyanescens]